MNKGEDSLIGSTVLMSAQGYSNLINTQDGKDLHWTTDIKTELPIKMDLMLRIMYFHNRI